MAAAEARDTAIRDAKRYIHEIVRNDWCFEPSTSTTGPRFQSSWPISEQEVTEWRLREYDETGSENSDFEEEDEEGVDGSRPAPEDNERRRKRRRQMEEEMVWNEGLRTWMERRDAWSGARTRREIRGRGERMHDGDDDTTSATDAALAAATGVNNETSALASKTEASLSIAENGPDEGEQQQATEANMTEPERLSEAADPDHYHHHLEQKSFRIPDETFTPVVPSIISSTNPIRASITPTMYPSIYSKVIVQSLTPTVPINLADVTKAMVQGWKADGQWPTKPKPTSIVLQDDATVRRKDDAAAAAETKKKSGVASAVRKVLHFSGFHPHNHPFHRRGASHGSSHHDHGQQVEDAGPSNTGK